MARLEEGHIECGTLEGLDEKKKEGSNSDESEKNELRRCQQ